MSKKNENMTTNGKQKTEIKHSEFPLTRMNFILMLACGLLIVVGFVLMLGGQNQIDHFNNDIFSARRIVVGPTMAFLGFVGMAFAIIYKKREK